MQRRPYWPQYRTSPSPVSGASKRLALPDPGIRVESQRKRPTWQQTLTTPSSSARARRGACWPTGCPPIPAARVLLLEAGGRDNYHWIHIPVGYLYLMGNPRADWGFKTAAEPGLNGRSLAYPRGRVLGGCSSINGMIYMRGQARDYDTVAADGQSRLGLGRRAALLQEAPGPVGAGARGLRRPACARRRVAHRACPHPLGDPGCVPRGGGRGRHPQGRGLQPRRQRGLRLLPRQPEDRHPLEHLQGLPAPRAAPAQPGGRDARAWSSGWCSTASASPGW